MSAAESVKFPVNNSQHIHKNVKRLEASDSTELRSYVRGFGIQTRGATVDWQDVAEVGTATAGVSTFGWLIFRFFVGAAIGDSLRDVSKLKTEMTEIKHALDRREDKLDQLLLALATKN